MRLNSIAMVELRAAHSLSVRSDDWSNSSDTLQTETYCLKVSLLIAPVVDTAVLSHSHGRALNARCNWFQRSRGSQSAED